LAIVGVIIYFKCIRKSKQQFIAQAQMMESQSSTSPPESSSFVATNSTSTAAGASSAPSWQPQVSARSNLPPLSADNPIQWT